MVAGVVDLARPEQCGHADVVARGTAPWDRNQAMSAKPFAASNRSSIGSSQLGHEHYLRREMASTKLVAAGPAAVDQLAEAIRSGDLEVVERAAAALVEIASVSTAAKRRRRLPATQHDCGPVRRTDRHRSPVAPCARCERNATLWRVRHSPALGSRWVSGSSQSEPSPNRECWCRSMRIGTVTPNRCSGSRGLIASNMLGSLGLRSRRR